MAPEDIIEQMARVIWDARAKFAANKGIVLEQWGDGSIPRACGIFEEAAAIFNWRLTRL